MNFLDFDFQDSCLENLQYATEYLNDVVEMSSYAYLFESEDPANASVSKNNESLIAKAVDRVKKAIQSVIALMKRIKDSIANFFSKLFMNKNEKAAFEEFKRQVAEDPELRNKKVTVKDFRTVCKEYDALLNEIEVEERRLKANETHPVDAMVDKVKAFLGHSAQAATVIVGTDAAIRIAETHCHLGSGIQAVLNNNIGNLNDLMKEHLGEEGANAAKRKIDAATKQTLLVRLKVRLLQRKDDTLRDCIHDSMTKLKLGGFNKEFKSNQYTGDVAQHIETGVKTAHKAHNYKNEVKKAAARIAEDKLGISMTHGGSGPSRSVKDFILGTPEYKKDAKARKQKERESKQRIKDMRSRYKADVSERESLENEARKRQEEKEKKRRDAINARWDKMAAEQKSSQK